MDYVEISIDRNFDGSFIQAFGILKNNKRISITEEEYKKLKNSLKKNI